MAKYLHPVVPIHPDEIGRYGGDPQQACFRMIEKTVEQMYEPQAIATDSSRSRTRAAAGMSLYFKDFNSGAIVENIVRRAKKDAIKRFLSMGDKGIKTDDLLTAIRDEFKENEDLPNTTNPDDWAPVRTRVSGSCTCAPSWATTVTVVRWSA